MRIAPILIIVVLAAGGAAGYAYWQQQAARVPPGLARANGRIEIERVDAATKYAGRLSEVGVKEGASVEKGEIVASIDTTEILAQLTAAQASVHRAHQSISGTGFLFSTATTGVATAKIIGGKASYFSFIVPFPLGDRRGSTETEMGRGCFPKSSLLITETPLRKGDLVSGFACYDAVVVLFEFGQQLRPSRSDESPFRLNQPSAARDVAHEGAC
jgi:hypothetical protein